jgi:hypothetical protein
LRSPSCRLLTHCASRLGSGALAAVARVPVRGRANRALLNAAAAYRQVFTSSAERTQALDPWLNHYNTERIHPGIGTTPLKRVSPT